ncbi:tautomerase family protein [Neobacillus rhizosphaerae]|uniref:tautomerase family protein n=1 Tax=Neobacillus rhizosphaerae TaxID=2880965 RepID=UPI003D26605C
MPIVELKIVEGREAKVKKKLVKDITDVIAENLSVPHDKIRILLYEIPAENWIVGGTPKSSSPE